MLKGHPQVSKLQSQFFAGVPLNVGVCPLGIFVDNAMDLVRPPPWTDGQMVEYYHSAVSEALSHGLTSIHDAWSTPLVVRFLKKCSQRSLSSAMNLIHFPYSELRT